MTSSSSSSADGSKATAMHPVAPGVAARFGARSRGRIALALAVALASCAHARPPAPLPRPWSAGARPRLALFPLRNVSGDLIPARSVALSLEAELEAHGAPLVPGEELDRFLARHRVRYTDGVARETALALRDELGVEGVLFPSVDLYATKGRLAIALGMRLVATADADILWAGGVARTGDDAPGLFGLGIVDQPLDLERREVSALGAALFAYLDGRERPRTDLCPSGGRFSPRADFRSAQLDRLRRPTIAVLPFLNESQRREAGEAVALQFVRQLVASGDFVVLEPGVVRDSMLEQRIVMDGGVSLEQARLVQDQLGADLVLGGLVSRLDDQAGPGGPAAEFSAYVLERASGLVIWSSTSRARGDDRVWFFDHGRVSTASALVCGLTSNIVAVMAGRAPNVASRERRPTRATVASGASPGAGSAP